MRCGKGFDALRGGDHAHKLDIRAAALFQKFYRVDRRAARGKHGVAEDDLAVFDVVRQFAVIFVGFQRFFVAVKPDVTDFRGREKGGNAVYHAETGAQDRDDRHVVAGENIAFRCGDGRFNLHFFQRKISENLVSHQHGDFLDEFSELLGRGVYVAQKGNFVSDQRVLKNGYVFSHVFYLCFS